MVKREPGRFSISRGITTGVMLAGCVVATLIPTAASAKGKTPTPTGAPTCWVNPTTVALGDQYTISGSGYAANENLQEWINGYGTTMLFTGADASGNFTGASAWANHSGSYSVSVKDSASGKILANCAFTIA